MVVVMLLAVTTLCELSDARPISPMSPLSVLGLANRSRSSNAVSVPAKLPYTFTPLRSAKEMVRVVPLVGLYCPAATQISSPGTTMLSASCRSVKALDHVSPVPEPVAATFTW